MAKRINDELAEAIHWRPDRFRGFATLGMKQPDEAALELERCVKELGFVGAMVDGTVESEFLDHPKFIPVFQAAQRLDVPIYLHPAIAPLSVRDSYYAGLPGNAGFLLAIAGWGWHAELGLHILRLIVSGLFDKLPNLKVIIGHMGEGVPYALARSSRVLEAVTQELSMSVADFFKRNVYVTTSGYFTLPPLRCALDVLGKERLLFSIDYPFSTTTQGQAYLDQIKESGYFTDEDLVNLAYGNAERLLKLGAPAPGVKQI
jgi:predicted TIM-barrel fold metal-dependent hydrolase